MLKNFTIKNYKSIKELEIKNLNRINLLVGRNNAGKSNILEAILLYATHFNLNSIMQINSQRSEQIISPQLIERGSLSSLCLPLAHNRSILSLREGIKLNSGQEDITLQQVKVGLIEKEGSIIRNYSAFRSDEVIGHGVPRVVIPTKSGMQYFKLTYELSSINTPCIYVNCATKQMPKWTKYWDNIVLSEDKGNIIKALQIIDSKIEDVAVISREITNQLRPYVKVEGNIHPLFAMGDGTVHMFNIMLALINAKNGILLLDEMENGLHVRTLEKLWKIVNDLSKQWNVQVFVTTHSNDCIRAFKDNAREEGTLYHINCKNGKTFYESKDFKTIEKSLSAGIDLRDYTNAERSEDEE